jgi:hypothetical protein
MILHTTGEQPVSTYGKVVKISFYDSAIQTIYLADEMNWKLEGQGAPTIGRIFAYEISNR